MEEHNDKEIEISPLTRNEMFAYLKIDANTVYKLISQKVLSNGFKLSDTARCVFYLKSELDTLLAIRARHCGYVKDIKFDNESKASPIFTRKEILKHLHMTPHTLQKLQQEGLLSQGFTLSDESRLIFFFKSEIKEFVETRANLEGE